MKELSGIEKLELVRDIFNKLGYDFSKVTVSEAFTLLRSINEEIYYFVEEKNCVKPDTDEE
jgi:formylmethanofuran dehydrogenase subunit E